MSDGLTGHHNYELNAGTVLRDLYRLLCILASERHLLRVIKRKGDPLLSLRARFVEDEIVHLLVQTAVMNRLQLEHLAQSRDGSKEPHTPIDQQACGDLQDDVLQDHVRILSFREACNKIVHAKQIAAARDAPTRDVFDRMPEGLILRGSKDGKAWQAHLSIYEYIRASVLNFESLADSPKPEL